MLCVILVIDLCNDLCNCWPLCVFWLVLVMGICWKKCADGANLLSCTLMNPAMINTINGWSYLLSRIRVVSKLILCCFTASRISIRVGHAVWVAYVNKESQYAGHDWERQISYHGIEIWNGPMERTRQVQCQDITREFQEKEKEKEEEEVECTSQSACTCTCTCTAQNNIMGVTRTKHNCMHIVAAVGDWNEHRYHSSSHCSNTETDQVIQRCKALGETNNSYWCVSRVYSWTSACAIWARSLSNSSSAYVLVSKSWTGSTSALLSSVSSSCSNSLASF